MWSICQIGSVGENNITYWPCYGLFHWRYGKVYRETFILYINRWKKEIWKRHDGCHFAVYNLLLDNKKNIDGSHITLPHFIVVNKHFVAIRAPAEWSPYLKKVVSKDRFYRSYTCIYIYSATFLWIDGTFDLYINMYKLLLSLYSSSFIKLLHLNVMDSD